MVSGSIIYGFKVKQNNLYQLFPEKKVKLDYGSDYESDDDDQDPLDINDVLIIDRVRHQNISIIPVGFESTSNDDEHNQSSSWLIGIEISHCKGYYSACMEIPPITDDLTGSIYRLLFDNPRFKNYDIGCYAHVNADK